jgi:putative ABC transport system permease protein
VKDELVSFSGITSVAASLNVPGEEPGSFYCFPVGTPEGKPVVMQYLNIDYDFLNTMNIEILAGSNFSKDMSADARSSIIINKTAAISFGWVDNPGDYSRCIGKIIKAGGKQREVIGVISDFHLQSVHKAIAPLFIEFVPGYYNTLSIRTAPGYMSETIDFLKRKWVDISPGSPFDFRFLDESYDRQYRADEKLSEIFSCFTILAVFIACLGLFGMAAFSAQQRVKEIGIRKVLGATSGRIVFLIGSEMMKLILTANAVAWPLVYFISHRWLTEFAYHIDLRILTFINSSLLVLCIGIITISYQSFKSAVANPIDSLRNE